MRPRPVRAAALIFFLLLAACIPAVTADYGGYSVAPAKAGATDGPPLDTKPISFFDLDLREMLIALALSFCPVLVYPVELFFSLKLLLALGYRKVEKNAVLWNQNRREIFASIAANPGVRFVTLERLTGIKEGTLKYHLLILEAKRRIVSFGSGRSLRYFENNGRYNTLEKRVFFHLQNPTTRKILEILAASPEVSRKDIAGIVGIAGPSITWHTKRLAGDGIISTSKKGRAVRYTLCPAGLNVFRQYTGMSAGESPGSADGRG
ncbi:winged helix-turn-helix transcriptional regulator [Methanoregula sp. UBA64]|jgi:predicted transcriptional regulator|uniref:winged helix-turn-helix transcriptional regulator n=1 Tax=Methanoregula sp. UBA64 TaxID=1915554 RepID=UPI0025F36A63|nr:winged helix-turn-helix transcriptional regulator [Methanoregula sp. UBA64]